jgi:myo-inositol 2-dehydrogenase / D-chiro-inositol 1-dehydrogenase
MIRVGIIGAGHMGKTHALDLKRDERVQIIGVADVMEKRAQALALEVGGEVYATPEALLKAGPDAVYVCTPNTLHTDAVLGALKCNVHVFSEKPMATSLREAKQILEAASRSKGIYQIGFNRRFAPAYKFARKQIGEGFHPYSANIKMNRGELINPQWVCNRAITGGFLYESTIHLLDMIRWLMGEVVEVQCKGQQNVCAEMDDFAMILTFASRHFAAFSSSAHTSWAFPFERIELYGGHSSIVTEEMEKVIFSPGLAQEIVVRDYFQLEAAEKWGYREEDHLFMDSITWGHPPAVTAADGYKAVELVEACYQSAAMNGAPLPLPLS